MSILPLFVNVVVGYCGAIASVDLPPHGQCAAIGINFTGMQGRPLTLAAIFGTNQLIADAVYARADKIYLWDPVAQDYERYAQQPSGDFSRHDAWQHGSPINPIVPLTHIPGPGRSRAAMNSWCGFLAR